MLKNEAHYDYLTLTREYDTNSCNTPRLSTYTKSKETPLYYTPGWHTQPQSYFLHDIIDMSHFKAGYAQPRHYYKSNAVYPWTKPRFNHHYYRGHKTIEDNFDKVTGYKDNTPYTPFRNYTTIKIPKGEDSVYDYKLHKLPDKLKQDDIQCILGMRLYKLINGHNKYYNNNPQAYYHSNLSSILIHYGLANTNILSVVYISRKDGLINHDIYYSWCKETRLAFPEDLKHTELNNDTALSNIRMNKGIKSKHAALSVIDSIRNKKEYIWYLPFTQWMKSHSGNTFSRPHKSSYNKPKGISTWKKRRIARRKEARR